MAHDLLQISWMAPVLLVVVEMCVGENTTSMPDDEFSTIDYDGYQQQCKKRDVRQFRSKFLPAMYGIICFVGLVGNGLVILRYFHFKRLKTGTDYYMLNLALADMLFLLTLPFWAVSVAQEWIFGNGVCKIIYCLYKMSFFCGMFLLMCVSIERYFAIVEAPSAHRHRSKTVLISKLSSVGIWVVAFFLSIPELIYSGVKEIDSMNVCIIFSDEIDSLNAKLKVSQMFFGFLLPLIIMSFCYSMIIKKLLQARNFEKYKAIKVIIVIVIVFVVFQLPYNSVMLIRTYSNITLCETSKQMDIADDVTYSLACFRCCLNPFLYAIIGIKFRNDLIKLFKDLGCVSKEKFGDWASTTKPSKRTSIALETTETTTTFSP
ncbi:C-C chemokine receptor type 7 [Spea bombifrons]|uniref:C-C chemokine receptor type 7 n=1 Tax=Spea bombifrons TaxID=233779 RepID=UPI00234A4C03|nr:C-C chemokine receptor type 7 [Spea bombifrons]